MTTARANQTTGLTNGTAANWAPEVEFSPYRALSRRQRIRDAQECPKVAFFGTRLGKQSPWIFGLNRLFDEVRTVQYRK